MMSEETVYDRNEATRLDELTENVKGNESASTTSEAPVENKDKHGVWKKVAVGTGTGIVFGAAATILTSSSMDAPETEGEGTMGEDVSANLHPMVDDAIPVATCVDDDMSFSQAFAAARAEVGSGGAFEWHGQLYNTYTAEEWEHMSAGERAEYGNHFAWSSQADHSPHTAHVSEPVATGTEDEVQVVHHETEQSHMENNDTGQIHEGQSVTEVGPDDDVVVVGNTEPDVEVLGVVHEADTGMNVGAMVVDGQEVFLIDVDNDQVFDVMASDLNGDGQIQENEMADISGQHITVNDMGGILNPNDNILALNDEPDYINDVDGYEA